MTRRFLVVSSLLVLCGATWQPSAAQARILHKPIIYAVTPGDSLWSISERTHVSLTTIEKLNHLTDRSVLQLGQSLVIGQRTVAAVKHVRRPVVAIRSKLRHATSTRSTSWMAISTGSARRLASQAVWAAMHVGPNAPPASAPLNFAEQAIALDARITGTALRYLGVPYVWGGTSFGGVDCSGFVWAVFAKNGIYLPRTADAQYEEGRRVSSRDLRAGDLVFFQTYALGASHVGIYLGNGKFVHASSSNGVRVDQLAEEYYSARYLGARRLAKV